MVAVKAKMKDADTVDQLVSRINSCEAALKKQIPEILWVFFEPDVRE
jgi:hypothetical protein